MQRFTAWAKEMAWIAGLIEKFPWEVHLSLPADRVAIAADIVTASQKARHEPYKNEQHGPTWSNAIRSCRVHVCKARKAFKQMHDPADLTIETATMELDSDCIKGLDTYITLEAMALASLHMRLGATIARSKVEELLPTVATCDYTIDAVTTEIKLWMARGDVKWLGDAAKSECRQVLEAIQAVKDHDRNATKNMTSEWTSSIATRLGFFLRVDGPAGKDKKPIKLAGKPAATMALERIAAAQKQGDHDKDAYIALLPFQFLLDSAQQKQFLELKAVAGAIAGSSTEPAMPAAKKPRTDEADIHAKTWQLFAV